MYKYRQGTQESTHRAISMTEAKKTVLVNYVSGKMHQYRTLSRNLTPCAVVCVRHAGTHHIDIVPVTQKRTATRHNIDTFVYRYNRPPSPSDLRRVYAATSLLGLRVRIPPRALTFVSCFCLSCRQRPLCVCVCVCVCVCHIEISTT